MTFRREKFFFIRKNLTSYKLIKIKVASWNRLYIESVANYRIYGLKKIT